MECHIRDPYGNTHAWVQLPPEVNFDLSEWHTALVGELSKDPEIRKSILDVELTRPRVSPLCTSGNILNERLSLSAKINPHESERAIDLFTGAVQKIAEVALGSSVEVFEEIEESVTTPAYPARRRALRRFRISPIAKLFPPIRPATNPSPAA